MTEATSTAPIELTFDGHPQAVSGLLDWSTLISHTCVDCGADTETWAARAGLQVGGTRIAFSLCPDCASFPGTRSVKVPAADENGVFSS